MSTKSPKVNKKRRRTNIENQLREAITSPPKLSEKVKPNVGVLHFNVPSTSGGDMHKVMLSVDGGMKYTCDCLKVSDEIGVCKHIKAVIIHMMIDLIKKQDESDNTLDLMMALDRFNIEDVDEMVDYDLSDGKVKYDKEVKDIKGINDVKMDVKIDVKMDV